MYTFLIDGNNVIRTNPEWEKMFKENPENAKNHLIQKVVDYFKDKGNQATIFFDGFSFVHSFNKISKNVNIKYSKNKTADETILLTIEKSNNPEKLYLVTNDKLLTDKVRLYKCRLMSSDDFIKKITFAKNNNLDKPDQLNKAEIEYWLRLFNINSDNT